MDRTEKSGDQLAEQTADLERRFRESFDMAPDTRVKQQLSVIREAARIDPAFAKEMAYASDPNARPRIVVDLGVLLADRELIDEGFALAHQEPSESRRNQLFRRIAPKVARYDRELSHEAVDEITNPRLQAEAMTNVGAVLDDPEVLRVAFQMATSLRSPSEPLLRGIIEAAENHSDLALEAYQAGVRTFGKKGLHLGWRLGPRLERQAFEAIKEIPVFVAEAVESADLGNLAKALERISQMPREDETRVKLLYQVAEALVDLAEAPAVQ